MPLGLRWAILLSELRMQGEDGVQEGQGPDCMGAADAILVAILVLSTFVGRRPAIRHISITSIIFEKW